jgi:hypothetical protein
MTISQLCCHHRNKFSFRALRDSRIFHYTGGVLMLRSGATPINRDKFSNRCFECSAPVSAATALRAARATRPKRAYEIGDTRTMIFHREGEATMLDLDQAIRERHSTRLFLPQPVPQELVNEALALAQDGVDNRKA